ncbi:MAG TPA: Rrf2 family transcriptional regulator [Candidatus Omnitrophota bacterium]|nr:Rrf2 family transcriptional regulator [Candidatus Omnitrophota bacterium]HPD84827.1 Rrf2 family transcriptional regulator [Candidatus Omnitrophota bacterium]HRZ03685.1 Rrf2 family transcriptional regulator [Candidatus Omnitrophota bacterium]
MIKISTKTRYALRALLEMACRNDRKLFRLEELSDHQNISRKYLENIFAILKKHHIVHSRVGKNGGFYLPTNIKEISLLKVLEALEGKVAIVHCLDSRNECERVAFCPANGIWNELNTAIKNILAGKNLKDLSAKEKIRRKCSYVLSRAKRPSARRRR